MADYDDLAFETAKGFIRLEFQDKGHLARNLATGDQKLMHNVDAQLQYWAPQVETFMKNNAPWTDRTGNARNGLFALAYNDGDGRGIVLGHSVPYGIWLEVKYSGEYAIIDPTLQVMGPLVMESIQNMLTRTRF